MNDFDTTSLGPIGEIPGKLTAASAVGDPITANGTTAVPLASITVGLGYGFGSGGGTDAAGEGGSGSGGGGGGGGSVRPVAVLEISSAGVKVQPVIDWNRIVFAVVALVGARGLIGLLKR
ncbi:MAG: spore germination protein GerW family protein [Dehalococcoidia bacterium]